MISNNQLITVIISAFVMLGLDYVYLSSSSNFFNRLVKNIQGSKIQLNMLGLVLCYLTLVAGINYFIILNNSLTKKQKLVNAVLLGLFVYGVYEFTNVSILQKWTWPAVILDTVWGGVLFLVTTWLTLLIVKKLNLK